FLLTHYPFTHLIIHYSLSFTHPPPTQIYTLSLHDALPISQRRPYRRPDIHAARPQEAHRARRRLLDRRPRGGDGGRRSRRRSSRDRKSTRLNSSHVAISYAVFCLKKKKKKKEQVNNTKSKY